MRNILYNHIVKCTECEKCKHNIDKCCESAINTQKNIYCKLVKMRNFTMK